MTLTTGRRGMFTGSAAAALAASLPLPALGQAKPVKIGLLTVKTGPLAQDVCASQRATPDSLVDAEIDLDDAGGPVGTLDVANGCDLADEDYSGLIGHLVERVFDCLGRLTRRSLCRGQRCG